MEGWETGEYKPDIMKRNLARQNNSQSQNDLNG